MKNFNFTQLVLLALAVTAASQGASPSDSDDHMSCIFGCAQTAGDKAGCSFLEQSCHCQNAKFQEEAGKCVTQKCPQGIPQAEALRQQECGDLKPAGPAAASGGYGN